MEVGEPAQGNQKFQKKTRDVLFFPPTEIKLNFPTTMEVRKMHVHGNALLISSSFILCFHIYYKFAWEINLLSVLQMWSCT